MRSGGLGGLGSADIVVRVTMQLRNRSFFWYRLAVRAMEAVTLVALGRDLHGLGVVAAAGCAAVDLGVAGWLRRSGPLPLWPRMVADSLDVAAWSLALGHSPDVAALAASPLACEAGLRLRWRGLVVPATVGGVTTAALLVFGRPPELAPFIWPALATASGAVVIDYLRHRMAHGTRLAAQQREAAASQAELAGQNSVANGVDTVIDLLTRVNQLIAWHGGGSPSRLGAWRQALAEACGQQATYLGVALARWQRLHNSMSPDLGADVELQPVGAAGTVLLSPAQARRLDRALSEMDLSGKVPVAVRSRGPAGRPLVMFVGGRRLILPADPGPAPPSLEAGPVIILLGGIGMPLHSVAFYDADPLWLTLPVAALAVPLTWWAHRQMIGTRKGRHADVVAVALAYGTLDAVLSSLAMHNHYLGGLVRLPFVGFLFWFAPLLVFYGRDLTRAERWLLWVGCAAAVAAGLAAEPYPVPPVHFLAGLVWPAATVLATTGGRALIELDADQARAELERRHRSAVEEGYRRGRQLVIDLATAAAAEASLARERLGDRLPAQVAAEVEARLTAVGARLATLREAEDPHRR